MDDRRFRMMAVLTALAGTTLSNGIIRNSVPLIAIGAALSAVFPWGIAAAWLIQRRRRLGCVRRGCGLQTCMRKPGIPLAVLALALAPLCAALLLIACTSSTGGGSAQPPTAASVASQIGATHVEQMDPTLYAYDEATATLHGKPVDIATFRTNDLRDKWVKAAGLFTGIEQTGDRYAVADG